MRSLFLSFPSSPLPLEAGWSARYWHLLLALRSLGDVDVWLFHEADPARSDLLARELGGQRVYATPPDFQPWTRASDLQWLFLSRSPYRSLVDIPTLRRRFHEWAAPEYDMVLCADPLCFDLVADLVTGPVVLDLDDVPDRTLTRELATKVRGLGVEVAWPRHAYRLLFDVVKLHRYRRLQREARQAGVWRLAVSEADRARLGGDHVAVVPNGYERSGPAMGDGQRSSPPTLLFEGTLQYLPNADAVVRFAREILPLVRAVRPGTRLVVAGAPNPAVTDAVGRCPGVELLGFVPRIEDALALADVAVAPLRLGGGTRIKILEAFAHRIPVVATSIGAEGLDVIDGRHLLIADTSEAFAAACVRLLDDQALRARVVDGAQELVEREYSWRTIRANFVQFLLDEVLADGSPACIHPEGGAL